MTLRARNKGILSEDYFKSISDIIGKKWKVLGKILNVKKSAIDRIDRVNNNENDKALAILKEWFSSMTIGNDGVSITFKSFSYLSLIFLPFFLLPF